MTTRSWHREDYDDSITAGQKMIRQDSYSQSGSNTPRVLREAKVYTENPYALEIHKVSNPMVPIAYMWNGSPLLSWKATPAFLGAAPVFESVPYPDAGRAIARLLGKWRESDFDLGVTIGEGRESAMLIVERLKSIVQAVQAVSRGNIRGAIGALGGGGGGGGGKRSQLAAAAGNFSSAFLELELGWKPLIRDIYALSDHIKVKPRKNVVRTSLTTRGGVFPQPGFPAGDIYGTNRRRLHLRVEVSQSPSEIERLGLTDPLSIAWNLVGLSFIADWFLPIGDTLQMWHALQAMPVTKCCTTEVYEAIGFSRVKAGSEYGGFPYTCQGSARYVTENLRMDRYVSTSPFALWGVLNQPPRSMVPKWDPTLRQIGILSALAHQRILRL